MNFNEYPIDSLMYITNRPEIVFTHGKGSWIYDNNGKRYLDAAAGLWCASLGYASERLARVAYEQMRKLGYYHLYRGTTQENAVDLAEDIVELILRVHGSAASVSIRRPCHLLKLGQCSV